jgi:heme exporter protein A
LIPVENLSVVFGRTVALHGVELELHPGVTGLFGPNASGKSTLLRVLAGLLRPTTGAAYWDGRPVSASDESFRRCIGYCGHEAGLYARLTVRENLLLFARAYGVDDLRIDDVGERLGLADRLQIQVGDLSAGLVRRVSVARAMLHDPQILLLDEPYANLDDDASGLVSSAISDWNAPDRFAVVASHGAKRVKAYASASLILKRGRVVSYRVSAGPNRGRTVQRSNERTGVLSEGSGTS